METIKKVDEDVRLDSELWKLVNEQGWLALDVPEEDGGLGIDQIALTLIIEEMGYVALPEPVAEQNFLVNDILGLFPAEIQEAIKSKFNSGMD